MKYLKLGVRLHPCPVQDCQGLMVSNQRYCLTGTCPGVNDYCEREIEDELLDALLVDIGRTGVPCRSPLNAPQEESKLPQPI